MSTVFALAILIPLATLWWVLTSVVPEVQAARYDDAKRERAQAHYQAEAKEAHDTHVSIVLDAIKTGTWAHTATWLEIAEIAVTALENDGIIFARIAEETL